MKKTDLPNLYKRQEGVFVFDRDSKETSDYLKRKNAFESQEIEAKKMKDQINKVEAEISEIKDLLNILIQKASK